MASNSESSSPPGSLRFIYLDETDLASIKTLHTPSDSTHRDLEWGTSSSERHPQSPCSVSPPQSHRDLHDHHSSHGPSRGRRMNLRKSLANALVSPVRAAKGKISLGSPKRMGESLKQALVHNPLFHPRRETWQQELDLPRHTTEEQAIAILLSRELDELDF